MTKEIILTKEAPQPVGPYSQAVKSGNLIFSAGQIPLDKDGKKVGEDVKTQTVQVFANIKAVLSEAGATLDNVIKTTVFLKDMNDFAAMNKIYAQNFDPNTAPARSTVEVARLPLDCLVEIEIIAQI